MSRLFKENFDGFRGPAWTLPSGAILDDRLGEAVGRLNYESPLHSFVVDDVQMVLNCFEVPADREAIERVMVTRQGEGLPELSSSERMFLRQYKMAPEALDEYLYTRACSSVGHALEEKPSKEFQKVAHHCMTSIFFAYQQSNFSFPAQPSESWFNSQLWGFLSCALSSSQKLEYKPGEVCSEASSRRRNKQRNHDSRQHTGHKVDGMVVATARALEMCYMEAARKDGGTRTTKCLNDTRKLYKLMKDGHDAIRERSKQDMRERLVTCGLRISGPTMTILSLYQRPGRFYQAVAEVTEAFPSIWTDEDDTRAVIAIVTWVLRLRQALLTMATSVKKWVTSMDSESPDQPQDWVAPTMTSPVLLSSPSPIAADRIPPLSL